MLPLDPRLFFCLAGSEMPIGSRSQGLRTVNPPIPESSLGCDLPRILSSEPLAEPPDPHGDHHQAANREGGNPDDEDGHRAQNCGDDPGLVVTLDNGGHEHGKCHAQSQEPCNSGEVPQAERTFMSSAGDGSF